MKVSVTVDTSVELTPRVKQVAGMFDVPLREKLSQSWEGEAPIEARDWNVGLIVGPSGSGKSTIARQMFGEPPSLTWGARSVIDDFDRALSIQDVCDAFSSVGFNTIPSWTKPFAVLSTGEKFRVELARRLIEGGDLVVMDEFTSVVDRQVARIGANAVQKYARKRKSRFVAVTCHYDVIEWLQPDWMLEPATMTFQWRSVQRRPPIAVDVARVDHSAWKLFAPFHYLRADLLRNATCFVLFVEGEPASFAGVVHRPHPKAGDIKGVSRLVTLPDYQGLGLALVLVDALGAAYSALNLRLHTYPAHPALVRAFDRSPRWRLDKRPGQFLNVSTRSSSLTRVIGARPCAVFQYAGHAAHSREEALALIGG